PKALAASATIECFGCIESPVAHQRSSAFPKSRASPILLQPTPGDFGKQTPVAFQSDRFKLNWAARAKFHAAIFVRISRRACEQTEGFP
ncbi:MAG: hypothetical protein CMJ78_14965, partial [Planctomycetaceae bacterium]|nr:hypothetical protein [Planctomycetaceae bacterium]